MKLIFIHKNDKSTFWATLWGGGNVRTSSIAHWKARCQLPIRDNWNFSLALTVETLSVDTGRSRRFSERGWSLWAQILGERRRRSNHCWCQKTRVFLLPHSKDRMILSSFVWIGYQRVTDRQTDGIAVANTALCIVKTTHFKNIRQMAARCTFVLFLRHPLVNSGYR